MTCGVGNKTRTRNCTEAKYGGKECICSRKDSESCKVMDCPGECLSVLPNITRIK